MEESSETPGTAAESSEILDNSNNTPPNSSQPKRYYRVFWEFEDAFQGWLTKGSDIDKAYCKCCKREFRAHKSTLLAHGMSESHKRMAGNIDIPLDIEIRHTPITSVGTYVFVHDCAELTINERIDADKQMNSSTDNSLVPTTTPNSTESTASQNSTSANKLSKSASAIAFSDSLIPRNKRGQIIGSGQKRIIVNMFNYKLKVKGVPKPNIAEEIHYETGVGLRSVKEIIKEFLSTGKVTSPSRKRPNCRKCYEKLNSTETELLRKKVQELFNQPEVPSISKMLEEVNADPDLPNFKKTSFYRVLHHLGFEFVRHGRNHLLVERKAMEGWKGKYVETILEYRADGLDETWLNVEDIKMQSLRHTNDS